MIALISMLERGSLSVLSVARATMGAGSAATGCRHNATGDAYATTQPPRLQRGSRSRIGADDSECCDATLLGGSRCCDAALAIEIECSSMVPRDGI